MSRRVSFSEAKKSLDEGSNDDSSIISRVSFYRKRHGNIGCIQEIEDLEYAIKGSDEDVSYQWIPHCQTNFFIPPKPNRPLFIANTVDEQPIQINVSANDQIEADVKRVDSKSEDHVGAKYQLETNDQLIPAARCSIDSFIAFDLNQQTVTSISSERFNVNIEDDCTLIRTPSLNSNASFKVGLCRNRSFFDVITRKKDHFEAYDPIRIAAENFNKEFSISSLFKSKSCIEFPLAIQRRSSQRRKSVVDRMKVFLKKNSLENVEFHGSNVYQMAKSELKASKLNRMFKLFQRDDSD
jgi:hypothetical protein